MLSNKIATVFLQGRGSMLTVNTGPGRKVMFSGGAATITNEYDMPAMLMMPGVQVEVEEPYADFVKGWVDRLPVGAQPVAKIVVVGDYQELVAPDYKPTRQPEPESPPALLWRRPRKGRPKKQEE